MNKKLLTIVVILVLLLSSIIIVTTLNIIKEGEEYEYYEVVVGFKEVPAHLMSSLIDKYEGIILEKNEKINAVLVKIKKGKEQTFIDKIIEEPQVEYAELNDYVHAFYVPDDPKWDEQWGPERIKCPDSWEIETGKKSIKIAIVDTGIDYTHEDLTNYVSGGYDFVNDDSDPMDDNNHGTHCGGIAAATIDNQKGIAGVAQVSIMAEKVLDGWGSGSFSDVADGIVHAVDAGVDIISMSLGSSTPSSAIEAACDYAWNNGVILVGASGNDYSSSVSYPAAYDSVIAVGALDRTNERTSWSNYGEDLELMAPGDIIISTIPNDDYEFYSGTSMACPHVAGVAALALSRHPDYTNQQIRDLLVNTADDLGPPGWDEEHGYGRVDSTFNDEVLITRPALNIDIHKLTRIDPIDPGGDKPEWYYKITVECNNTSESEYNYNGYNEKILFWWRFVWNSEYTWEVDKIHILNVSEPIVTVKIKLMEHDLIFDDIADISSNATRKIAQFKYDLKNNILIEDESDRIEKDGNWYVTNGEFDGSTSVDEDDAKLWFNISDNYDPLRIELKDRYFGRKNEEISITGSAFNGLPPYNYSWDMDNDGIYDDRYGKTVSWSWGTPGTYIVRLKVVDDFNQSEVKETTVYIDESSPIVEITKPKENSLYILNRKIMLLPLFRAWILGSINIEVDATDNIGVDKVELYIDNELKTTLMEEPYNWTWDEKTPLKFGHKIKIIAYDNARNSATDEITVWKFF